MPALEEPAPKVAAIRECARCDTPALRGSGRWRGRGRGGRWGNRRIRDPHPLVSGDGTVAPEHVSPVRILDDPWLRRCRRGVGLVNVSRRRRVGRRGRVIDGGGWVVDGGWRDDDPGHGVGQDFAHNDQRCEDRERGQADHVSPRPVASGVSCGRRASDEKDGSEQNRQDSTHSYPPLGNRNSGRSVSAYYLRTEEETRQVVSRRRVRGVEQFGSRDTGLGDGRGNRRAPCRSRPPFGEAWRVPAAEAGFQLEPGEMKRIDDLAQSADAVFAAQKVDGSLVLVLQIGKARLLLPGDAE